MNIWCPCREIRALLASTQQVGAKAITISTFIMNSTSKKKISEAKEKIKDAKNTIDDILCEEEMKFSNLSDSAQCTDRGMKMEEDIDNLRESSSCIDESLIFLDLVTR